jgi:predicted dehydrogenase
VPSRRSSPCVALHDEGVIGHDGVAVSLHASMAAGEPFAAPFQAQGTRGQLRVDNLVLPHRGHSVTTELAGVSRSYTVGGNETYDYQLDTVVRALETGEIAATEGHDFVPNMALMDAIYAAAGLPRLSALRRAQ